MCVGCLVKRPTFFTPTFIGRTVVIEQRMHNRHKAVRAKSAVVECHLGRSAFMRQNDLDYRRSTANAVEDFCDAAMTDAAQDRLQAFVDRRRANP